MKNCLKKRECMSRFIICTKCDILTQCRKNENKENNEWEKFNLNVRNWKIEN